MDAPSPVSSSSTAVSVQHSTCPLDCPDACSVLVNVQDGRAVKLRGNPQHPVTRGFLCAKVTKYLDRQYHADRLMYPLRRVGAKGEGRFERLSWDAALDEVATRLAAAAEEFGPESILPYSYAGTMGLLQGSGWDRRFFHRLGASRLDRTICATAGMVATLETLGARYSADPEEFKSAKLIIAWGSNVLGTNVHLWPFIVEARRNGARFIVIDPVRNRTGAAADKHYFIHPGTDAALALGMLHVIFAEGLEDADFLAQHGRGAEELRGRAAAYPPERAAALTGIAAEEIAALAREYATTKGALLRPGYGLQRSERGGMAMRLIHMLPVVTGAFRHYGGGIQLSTSQAFQLNRAAVEMPELQQVSALGRESRLVNMSQLAGVLAGDALEANTPPVKALVVYNSNPAAIAPAQNRVRQGLRREDLFTVVLDQMQTDTADFADIVLPVTTFLEHTDLYIAYGHHHLQLARPVVSAPGECKSNGEIFRLLAQRLGFTDACFHDSDDDVIRAALASGHAHLEGITLERLDAEHSVRLNLPQPFRPFENGGFGFADGKANLTLNGWDYTPPAESRLGEATLRARYPLEFVSAKNDNSMNSTFGNRVDTDAETAKLFLHAEDAGPRGIMDGDWVRVFNSRGECVLRAEVNGHVAPGTVAGPSVRSPRFAPDGANANMLTSERLTDLGGAPTFYSCLVQVERRGD
jgi:anaerobic selenocysteine-containing dehydrogenase